MDSERARRIEDLFHDALDLAPDERGAWLARACDGDDALRRDVESLLVADQTLDELEPLSPEALTEVLAETADPRLGTCVGPYRLESVLGEGGMGRVYLGRREGDDFEQRVAVKLVRPGPSTGEVLARFAHERATLARLQHPGIARLVDGGTVDGDVPWLAMEHVQGQPLDTWCDGRGLDLIARVELFAEICDAVAYAHEHLVVHRDLKPSNVLVDDAGRPHLLDFGVARVLDADEGPRITRGAAPHTPAYASPEQVRGEAVGVTSDVYSLGVMLHELLTGRLPYDAAALSPAALDRAICEAPLARPSDLVGADAADTRSTTTDALGRRLRGDLDNILLKALEKDPGRRYASVAELARDLRRHLAGHPVTARAPTLGYRATKFVGRHRTATVLSLVLVGVVITAAAQWLTALRRDQEHLGQLLRLSDARRLATLVTEAEESLWPATPDRRDALDRWLERADELLARRPQHAARRAELAALLEGGTIDESSLWWHEQLERLVVDLDRFGEDDPFGATRASVARRRADLDRIEEASLGDPAWPAALASIADPESCPAYEGLELEPLWGLAPLHRDPSSGLWEFWLVASGERPRVDPRGQLVMDGSSAAVLVLVPPLQATLGAQNQDVAGLHYDRDAGFDEMPVHAAELAPFLIGKHELTQGQWLRLAGKNPSEHHPPQAQGTYAIDLSHPVEQVSWDDATRVLARFGLVLPTEARWEAACRGGTSSPWSSGPDVRDLDLVANLADLFARDGHREIGGQTEGWNYAPADEHDLDDGAATHAPVGSYAPNPLGLHDVHGNLWEWCLDPPAAYWSVTGDPDDPTYLLTEVAPDGTRHIPDEATGVAQGVQLTPPESLDERILRGGAFSNPPSRLRSSARWSAHRGFTSVVTGVRVARELTPLP